MKYLILALVAVFFSVTSALAQSKQSTCPTPHATPLLLKSGDTLHYRYYNKRLGGFSLKFVGRRGDQFVFLKDGVEVPRHGPGKHAKVGDKFKQTLVRGGQVIEIKAHVVSCFNFKLSGVIWSVFQVEIVWKDRGDAQTSIVEQCLFEAQTGLPLRCWSHEHKEHGFYLDSVSE